MDTKRVVVIGQLVLYVRLSIYTEITVELFGAKRKKEYFCSIKARVLSRSSQEMVRFGR